MPRLNSYILISIGLVAFLWANPARADFQNGVEAWGRGEYEQAIVEWLPIATAGNPDAQFNLGQAYKLGRGVPTNLDQAEVWYRRAADQGHERAESNLGLVLFATEQREEALPYLERAANRNEPRALYVMGTVFYNGLLRPKDLPRAYALIKHASDMGFVPASERLIELERRIPARQRQQGLALLAARAPALNETHKSGENATKVANTPAPIAASAQALSPSRERFPPPSSASVHTQYPRQTPGNQLTAPPPPPSPPAVPIATREAQGNAISAYPANRSSTTPTNTPRTSATNSSLWRVQFGAFSTRTRAEAMQRTLQRSHPSLARRTFHLVEAGDLVRLQVGNFALRSAAASLCTEIKSRKQNCIVVKGK